jgi:hypothetical protein
MVLDMLWTVIVIVLSSVPLYIAVKLMGGHTGILKVIIVNIIVALAVSYITSTFNFWAGALSFIVMLFIYKVMFKLSWLKAFLAWILQFIIIALIIFLLVFFGVLTLLL